MSTTSPIKKHIEELKNTYDSLRVGKESLLTLLREAEIPEAVYNSNAIENSTLSLPETEKILLEMEVSRTVSVREVYEARNLARVLAYIEAKASELPLSKETILLLHKMLIGGIDDAIAGRFRQGNEMVRVGTHIAPRPEKINDLLDAAITHYSSNAEKYFVDKIAVFHLAFENTHPFIDGNGRIGRVLIQAQLEKLGYPGIIIRDREKQEYYRTFGEFRNKQNTKPMEKIISLGLMESLHKRIAYLTGETIIPLAEYWKRHTLAPSAVSNAARRQNIPAFREKGVWKISENFTYPKK